MDMSEKNTDSDPQSPTGYKGAAIGADAYLLPSETRSSDTHVAVPTSGEVRSTHAFEYDYGSEPRGDDGDSISRGQRPPSFKYESYDSIQDDSSVPEGGTKGWLSVLGGFLLMVASFGWINSFSVFQTYYGQVQLKDESPSTIAWIGSVQIFGCYGFGIVSGVLMDKKGAKFPTAIGSMLLFIGILCTSWCSKYYQFLLAQGICSCIGSGMIMVPAITAPAQYFQKKQGIASAVALSGSSIGGVIWPIALDQMLNHDKISFGWTLRITAFIQLGVLALGVTFISSRFRNTLDRSEKPPFGLALKDPGYVTWCLASLSCNFGLYAPFFYITDYALFRGVDVGMAFYTASILNAASFFGRGISGYMADLVGATNTAIFCSAISAVLLFAWNSCTDLSGIIVWSIFYGFFSGGIVSTLAPGCLRYCKSPKHGGAYGGLGALIVSWGTLACAPIAGHIIAESKKTTTLTNMFKRMTEYCGAMLIVGLLFFTANRFFTGGLRRKV